MVGLRAPGWPRLGRFDDLHAPLFERRAARFVYGGVRQQRRSPEHLAGLVEVLEYGDRGAADRPHPRLGVGSATAWNEIGRLGSSIAYADSVWRGCGAAGDHRRPDMAHGHREHRWAALQSGRYGVR